MFSESLKIAARKNILIISICFSPIVGGVETHLDDLVGYLTENGYKGCVITYGSAMAKTRGIYAEKRGGLGIRRIPWFNPALFHRLEQYPLLEFLYMTPPLLLYSSFFMLGHHGDIDIIHAHGLNAAFVTRALAKVFGKRTVVSIHAIYDLPKRHMLARLMRVTLSSFDVILTLAVRSKRELIKIGLDSKRIKVFTYWVDQTVFRPMNKVECKRKLGLEGKFMVLFVGRLLEIKGVKVLVEVANRLAEMAGIVFVFVGVGLLANEVKVASEHFGNVLYVGKVENKELSRYYNAADVVVVPSIYEEGFGRVIVEALSCGVPVVASNKGGIPEALGPCVGILIEPAVDEIQLTIERLYEHPEELANLRRSCRVYAEKRFSENNARTIEESYYAA